MQLGSDIELRAMLGRLTRVSAAATAMVGSFLEWRRRIGGLAASGSALGGLLAEESEESVRDTDELELSPEKRLLSDEVEAALARAAAVDLA